MWSRPASRLRQVHPHRRKKTHHSPHLKLRMATGAVATTLMTTLRTLNRRRRQCLLRQMAGRKTATTTTSSKTIKATNSPSPLRLRLCQRHSRRQQRPQPPMHPLPHRRCRHLPKRRPRRPLPRSLALPNPQSHQLLHSLRSLRQPSPPLPHLMTRHHHRLHRQPPLHPLFLPHPAPRPRLQHPPRGPTPRPPSPRRTHRERLPLRSCRREGPLPAPLSRRRTSRLLPPPSWTSATLATLITQSTAVAARTC
mmetsp:Transcript_171/g.546  ORF Transcript_171/g.546 Transcript_171/m.546 type:complete len:252 (-) Transcript_171:1936-2691(-)